MSRARSIAPIVSLVLLVGACSNDGGATGPTEPPTGPTSLTGSSGPTATGPSESPAALPDGRHFGYVRSVDVAAGSFAFDDAEFLTGEEANEAAEEHGDEAPPPNDYYIVNDDREAGTLTISPALEIELLDWNDCCDQTFQTTLTDFATAIDAGEQITIGGELYYGALSQYWVTVEGGVVRLIEEQYLP